MLIYFSILICALWKYFLTKYLLYVLVPSSLLTLQQQPANDEETPLTSSTCCSVDLDKGTTRFLMSHDPAKWPRILKDHERCEIVGNGPVQVTDAVFPQHIEKVPWRFTKDNYEIVKSRDRGLNTLSAQMQYSALHAHCLVNVKMLSAKVDFAHGRI